MEKSYTEEETRDVVPLEPSLLVRGAKKAFPASEPVGTYAENESGKTHEHSEITCPVHELCPKILVFPDNGEIHPMGNGSKPCPETIVGIGKLQDIGGSGRDVKLVFFRTVEVEFVDGKFPLVMGEGYPLVEGVQGIHPGNLSIGTPASSPVFTECVVNNGSHDIRVRV